MGDFIKTGIFREVVEARGDVSCECVPNEPTNQPAIIKAGKGSSVVCSLKASLLFGLSDTSGCRKREKGGEKELIIYQEPVSVNNAVKIHDALSAL